MPTGRACRFADDLVATTARPTRACIGCCASSIATRRRGLVASSRRRIPIPRIAPVRAPARRRTELDLRAAGIATIVWATGYRRDYSWLDVPVLDQRGELVQTGGVTAAPGLYVVGLRFQSRRNSNFIDGVGHDARTVVEHLTSRRRDFLRVAV